MDDSVILLAISTLCILLSSLLLLAIVLPNNDNILFTFLTSPYQTSNAQPITQKDLVTYQKQSNFIKEYKIPLQEHGLKGITTDSQGNA